MKKEFCTQLQELNNKTDQQQLILRITVDKLKEYQQLFQNLQNIMEENENLLLNQQQNQNLNQTKKQSELYNYPQHMNQISQLNNNLMLPFQQQGECAINPMQFFFNSDSIKNEPQNQQIENNAPQRLPPLSTLIDFSVESKQTFIQLSKTQAQQIPVVINLNTKDLFNQNQSSRKGIDLVCVIDTSQSMMGESLDLVKDTLLYLLKELNEKDRISLISFNHNSTILCEFTEINQSTIHNLNDHIRNLSAQGSTDITKAMNSAFELISNRINEQNIASIFLLSDGQDQGAEQQVQQNYQNYRFNSTFVIHTFGYGSDHDPTLMRDIAKIKDGSFYYISDLNLVEECFIDAVAGLFSVIAQDIILTVEVLQPSFSNDLRISKTYGNWNFDEQTQIYSLKLNQLLYGAQKNFVLELNIPPVKKSFNNDEQQQKNIPLLKVKLTASNIDPTETMYIKQLELVMDIYEEDEEIKLNENDLVFNKEVVLNHLRVKCSDSLQKARELADSSNFQEAQSILDQTIMEIKESGYLQTETVLQVLQKDLIAAKEKCNPNAYGEGRTMIIARQYQHLNQQSQPMDVGSREELTLYANTHQTMRTLKFHKMDKN